MVITWISWGAAPGYIKIAPLGLFKAFQSDFCFSKSPVCSLLEYIFNNKVLSEVFSKKGHQSTQLNQFVNLALKKSIQTFLAKRAINQLSRINLPTWPSTSPVRSF
jgi:hypothetical protein